MTMPAAATNARRRFRHHRIADRRGVRRRTARRLSQVTGRGVFTANGGAIPLTITRDPWRRHSNADRQRHRSNHFHRCSNNERGFTLVEAMVAMMVCTIGLVAMAELMAVTLRLQQLGRNSTSAVRLAQDKIDELTTMPFNPAAANYNPASPAAVRSTRRPDANHNDTPMEGQRHAGRHCRRHRRQGLHAPLGRSRPGPDGDPEPAHRHRSRDS